MLERVVTAGEALAPLEGAGQDVEVLRTVAVDDGRAVELRVAPGEAASVLGCPGPCVVGVVVLAPPSALLVVADAEGVLAVEAAPAGLPPGRVTVRTGSLGR